MLIKNGGPCCKSTHILYLLKKLYSHWKQGEACKDKIVPGKSPGSVILHGVGLWAVLDTFGSAVNLNCWLCTVFYCAESDSAQCHTARSRTWFLKTYISMTFRIYVMIFQQQKSKNISTIQKWLTLRRVLLGAVSHCVESDSAQYHTVRSPTWRSISLRRVWLHAVLDNFGFLDISISQLRAVWYCVELDLEQSDTAWSLTRRSITLRGVTIFANILAKTNFL